MFIAATLLLTSTAAAGTITIAWDPNPESTVAGYIVYVGASAGNYTSSYDVGKTTTFTLPNAVAGTTYHMAVRAYSSSTNLSPMSADLVATIAATAALTAPAPLAPSGTIASTTPTYSWSAVAGAASYSLWVDDAKQVGKIEQVYAASQVGCTTGTGTCSITPPVALSAGAGTWWVKAMGATSSGPWSADRPFTIGSPLPAPAAPTTLAPSGTITLSTPTYSWSAVQTATAYSLWVDDASAVGKIQQVYSANQLGCGTGAGTCSITPAVALVAGAGHWWVKATNAVGDGPWSADRPFTVTPMVKAAVPLGPTLLAPLGTTSSNTPTFTWSAVPTATSYTVWVDDKTQVGKIQQVYSATQLGCAAGTGKCSVTPNVVLAAGQGSWWVKATNTAGDGPWSEAGSFAVPTLAKRKNK
jgi:hypothetical protein